LAKTAALIGFFTFVSELSDRGKGVMPDLGTVVIYHRYSRILNDRSYPLLVGEPKPLSLELIFQNTIFFDEIVDDCLLVSIKPTGQCHNQELQGMSDVRNC